ncbi:HAD-IA family hydrolase [Massiliimalia massiliensis]|uniref:HAD-IA family hydrolase n=1 Tax=Massiliimalia massiliensis TaxID=1852384 RepID=UPI00098734B5|nr:HAD-IA family hydrolase [Massiliimalia massiliensis]
MKYRTLLFDLDGTLTDSFEGITKSVQYALSHFGIEVDDLTELKCFIGPSLYDSFTEFYHMDHETALLAVEKYRERFRETGIYENKLYDGAAEMLESLHRAGFTICTASAKPEVFVRRVLDYFKLTPYFDFIAGSLFDGTRKEKIDVIRYVLEQQQITDLSSTLMIGDRKHDAEGAQLAGLPFCGVLYGFGGEEELAAYPHVYLAESAADLEEFLIHG